MDMDEITAVLADLYPGLVYTIQRDFETQDPYDHLHIHPDGEQSPEYQGFQKPSRQTLEDHLAAMNAQ